MAIYNQLITKIATMICGNSQGCFVRELAQRDFGKHINLTSSKR